MYSIEMCRTEGSWEKNTSQENEYSTQDDKNDKQITKRRLGAEKFLQKEEMRKTRKDVDESPKRLRQEINHKSLMHRLKTRQDTYFASAMNHSK